MINILLASHGPLAKSILDSAKMIVGNEKNIQYLTLDESDDPKEFYKKIESKIQCDCDNLIITDIPGGTPSNQSLNILTKYKNVRLVTGLNLSMVIEASLSVCDSIDELMCDIINIGKDSIKELSIIESSSDDLDELM